MIKQIRVLIGLPSAIVGIREKRTSYVTNRALKYFDLFVCLKSMTSSGLIKDYPSQMDEIKEFCKCGKGTFYKRLEELVAEGLVTVKKRSIHLASWEKVAEKYEITTIKYHKINYDTDERKQTVEYLIRAAEIAENKQSQHKQVKRRLDKTPEIRAAFGQFFTSQGKKSDFSPEALHEVQKITFATGAAEYDVLHSINVDVNRSGKGLKRAYNFHSNRSASYMKDQLEERGMAKITDRADPVCRFEGKGSGSQKRGRTLSIGSIVNKINPGKTKKGTKERYYTTFFKNNSKIWRLVDDIQINKDLFVHGTQ